MGKELRDKDLGDLVEALAVETVKYATGQWTSDSPYKSKEDYNRNLRENYIRRTEEIKKELNRREKIYKKK